jgi:hypothetical protein
LMGVFWGGWAVVAASRHVRAPSDREYDDL